MTSANVVLCSAVRPAIGAYGGALKEIPAPDPRTTVVGASVELAKLKATEIHTVVTGQVVQTGAKMNPARQAAINARIPVDDPAMTVNPVCGSGAQAIATAAQEVMLGFVKWAIAGSMENMDQSPSLMSGGRWDYRMGDAQIYDSMLRDGLNDAFCDKHSGLVTEDLVSKLQITREAQDRWAYSSQTRFGDARAAGKFDAEIAPIEVPGRKGPSVLAKDEHNRPDATLGAFAKLKPAFRKDGTVTAGNAPGLNSGAATLIVADADWAEKSGLAPMVRLVAYGIGAVEPGMFGLGPVPAVRQALERSGWKLADVERAEVNEAFAALAIIQELGLPEGIVNVEGAAIAHGHPVGATGPVLTTRLLHAMQRDGIRRGLVTLCIGGGQGAALGLEAVH